MGNFGRGLRYENCGFRVNGRFGVSVPSKCGLAGESLYDDGMFRFYSDLSGIRSFCDYESSRRGHFYVVRILNRLYRSNRGYNDSRVGVVERLANRRLTVTGKLINKGTKLFGDKSCGDKCHGDKSCGDKCHGDKSHGDKCHGDKSHGDKCHGDKVFGGAGCSGNIFYGVRPGVYVFGVRAS